jgi:transposase
MQFAGIDWADQHHDVVVLSEAGQQIGQLRVAHTAEGIDRLTAYLQGFSQEPESLAGVVETPHGLLVAALLEAGLVVYAVNPTTVNGMRPPSGVKTDALHARLLARKGRSDWPDLRVLRPDGPLVQELNALTRDLEALVREQTRVVNQLTACLKTSYPAALHCFDGLTRQVALAFLRAFPTLDAARQADVGHLRAVLEGARYPRAQAQAMQVQQALHAPQLEASAGMVRAKARLTLALVAQVQALVEQIAAYDQTIQGLFAQHADHTLFASLPGAGRRRARVVAGRGSSPGAGRRRAPRLLAEWGDDRAR